MPVIRELIEHWRSAFAKAGVDSPRLTVETIIAHVLGTDRGTLLGSTRRALTDAERERINELCARREKREPLAYLTGEREFYGRTFAVRPGVLIPRPETETIIDLAKHLTPRASGIAADVGCGSGCLAVTLALEFPALRVVALDVSPIALACTRENALKHGVAKRVLCVRADLLTAVAPGLSLCVSNPPYVDPADRATMQPEVRDFEPPQALYADEAGLAAARRVIAQARPLLIPGAPLLLEFGANQSKALAAAATQAGFTHTKTELDLTGMERILLAKT